MTDLISDRGIAGEYEIHTEKHELIVRGQECGNEHGGYLDLVMPRTYIAHVLHLPRT